MECWAKQLITILKYKNNESWKEKRKQKIYRNIFFLYASQKTEFNNAYKQEIMTHNKQNNKEKKEKIKK